MHAVTSFYHPTLSDWEINTTFGPSVLSRVPEDETLRSALVEALDLTQGLCTNAGHERLLGLLLGGNDGTVEDLTRALVGVIVRATTDALHRFVRSPRARSPSRPALRSTPCVQLAELVSTQSSRGSSTASSI